jgi:alanyl-tRNA synthetase
MFEKEYELDFFKNNGYIRKICESCGTPYWSLNADVNTCGDTPCVEYGFINDPVTREKYDISRMRNEYLKYFEKNGHTILERYPVIARWRDDIYLTIASIADFQPHVTSGLVPPPANPLVISQPCIRLVDLDIVGKSGRHLSNFEMMGHHAFNSPDEKIYWKDKTVEYCNTFFNQVLGISNEEITYKEDPWAGGGNAGPALEVMVKGLELATLVFMSMEVDPNGEFEIKGELYSPMDMNIVDPGYGLERLVWASQGTPTIYDAIYPELTGELFEQFELIDTIEQLNEQNILEDYAKLSGMMTFDSADSMSELRKLLVSQLNKKGHDITLEKLTELMTPIENIYTLADHSRALTFLFGDGVVPSNVKAGYIARLILRRALRIIDEMGKGLTLHELIEKQIEAMKDYPEFKQARDAILKIIDIEVERYQETLKKGTRLISNFIESLEDGKTIPTDSLINFYDTHGIHPSIVQKVAREQDIELEIPENFSLLLAARHTSEKREEQVEEITYDLPPTKLIYYDDENQREFDAKVIHSEDNKIVLDQTCFYPEGGGQPGDTGTFLVDGKEIEVKDVQKHGKVVVHHISDKIPIDTKVHGKIYWPRRISLMRHHSSTHVVLGSAREILGDHVWQTGAQKGTDRTRLDITHYEKLTSEDLRKIELRANEVVLEDIPIDKQWLDRNIAEGQFGFRLYQGGIPPGKQVRVVRIADFDVEACAGTHCKSTGVIGSIKILKSERIQDGVERLEFASGLAAIKNNQEHDKWLEEASSIVSVRPDQLSKTVKRFFEEWKKQRKELQKMPVASPTGEGTQKSVDRIEPVKIGNYNLYKEIIDIDMKRLIITAKKLLKKDGSIVVLGTKLDGAKILIGRSLDIDINCNEIIQETVKIIGGKGGGSPDFARGGGPDEDKLEDALEFARNKIQKFLK